MSNLLVSPAAQPKRPEHLLGLTDAQFNTLQRLWRTQERELVFEKFAAQASLCTIQGCVMVPWCGMYIGIEPDGYAHS